ncbi:MAG: PucR family transcriptional regulator ligand-binding domain-containing protein [Anaerotruncus massiliensis (ex Togo et al. 2019)]
MLSVSFQCREILTIPTIRNLRLLSGAEGLDRVVRWVYVAEAMENISMTLDWLIGDELVIITGSNLKENVTQELLRFIQRCNDKFVAGIVVNTGRYIPKLPPEAVALADDLHLPLFEVPWETKLVEFTKDIGAAIIDSSLEEESINAFMNDLLFGDIGGEENLLPRLARYGMEPNDKYHWDHQRRFFGSGA